MISMAARGLDAYLVLKGEATVGSLIMIIQLLNYMVTLLTKCSAAAAGIGQAAAHKSHWIKSRYYCCQYFQIPV